MAKSLSLKRSRKATDGEPTARAGLLKDVAYSRIRQLLVSGAYAPGTFLSERQLALQLDMSKTPVKAALERLEGEGFIAVSPQQGIVVRELSLREISDQLEIRTALEPFVVRSIAGNVAPAHRERLQHNLAAQEQAADQQDIATSIQLDAEFHLLLCEILGNREIVRVMRQLRDRVHRLILEVMQRQPLARLKQAYREHSEIVTAILEGDPDQAEARMHAHLDFGRRTLLGP
ncbi:MAG TPA: GntR family transcriptional regulator [Planctomycetaceae bacterium]|nr:GntR family transcriptional regulator [Planctomycetaceae bacterium]